MVTGLIVGLVSYEEVSLSAVIFWDTSIAPGAYRDQLATGFQPVCTFLPACGHVLCTASFLVKYYSVPGTRHLFD